MSTTAKLTLINDSNDTENNSVVIYQQNVATDFDDPIYAWKVIRNLGRGDMHSFDFTTEMQISVEDSFGNFAPLTTAENGQAFDLVNTDSGEDLQLSNTPAASPDVVEVRNKLQTGAIQALAYKNGKLVTKTRPIAPEQVTAFEFRPTIHIGAVAQSVEGELISPVVLEEIKTEINLFGVKSADIVMTGGGSGSKASPFRFALQNINSA